MFLAMVALLQFSVNTTEIRTSQSYNEEDGGNLSGRVLLTENLKKFNYAFFYVKIVNVTKTKSNQHLDS